MTKITVTLTEQEREVVKSLLAKQLEVVIKTEQLPNQQLGEFGAEAAYADILSGILKKL